MLRQAALVLMVVAAHSCAKLETANQNIVLNQVERSIDVASQLVKISSKLTLSNVGKETITHFHFVVEDIFADKIAFFGATTGLGSNSFMTHAETKLDQQKNASAWRIELKKPLTAGSEQKVDVEVVVSKALRMYPEEIAQREKQLVLFTGNHYFYSPYTCKSQVTKVTLASNTVESYSKLKPTSLSEGIVTYGPYDNIAPFSRDDMSIHFENSNPFLTVTKLERTIELSMWGNIAVEETIDIRHSGAVLKGSFSRYEFQRENSGSSAVKHFKTILPASATNIYYRDDIGLISTSTVKVLDEAVELDLRPRFPLFGGWKTHYTIGYNVPSYEYLYHNDDKFVLKMRLIDHVCDDMIVEEFSLKVILPEGSVINKLSTPYPVLRDADSKHFTYLDVNGRPVLNLRGKGEMLEKHIKDFQLGFTFQRVSMLREPLLLIAAFFTFFVIAIVYVRMDFSITKDKGFETKMKVACICNKIASHQEKRESCYMAMKTAITNMKASQDVSAFQTAAKTINADLKTETLAIAELASLLKTYSSEYAEKVAGLQKFDSLYGEHLSSLSATIEKFLGGKMSKQQLISNEAAILKKMEACFETLQSYLMFFRSQT